MGIIRITHISVYVRDQDEALAWYTDKLGFKPCEDNTELFPNFRWLTISPPLDSSTQLILMPVLEARDLSRVGTNPMFILGSDNCREDCEHLQERGVNIVDPPTDLPWGISAIFTDLYDNPYHLVQRKYFAKDQYPMRPDGPVILQ